MRNAAIRRSTIVATTTALSIALTALVAAPASAADHPVINEFSANITGTDVAGSEYVEVHGAPGADLSGHTVLLVEGDANANRGAVQARLPLGVLDANGLQLLAAPGFQNGSNSVLLVTGDVSAADIDADDDGTIDASVPFTVVDAVGVFDGGAGDAVYGTVLDAAFDNGALAPGGASRIPDGHDTDAAADWVRNDFDGAGLPGYTGTLTAGEALNTPGAANATSREPDPDPEPGTLECDASAVPISQVQGAGEASPLAGQRVEIEGVVIADQQQGGFEGYVVQEEAADQDADPATSEALFVYAPGGRDVQTGDVVRVAGAVSEYEGLTEITASDVAQCAVGAALPAPTELSVPLTAAESIESMLVTLPQELTVLETYNFARYGEVVLGTGRQHQPTAIFAPGSAEAVALATANAAGRITLDDGRSIQNPDPALHPGGAPFALDNIFRGGDVFANVTGVLDYRFGSWRIQPTEGADLVRSNPRPSVPEVGGSLQVAAFNVLNYFTTLGDRGANTQEEFERQQAKIVAAILELDADIVGLIEIQNDGQAVDVLVDALNGAAGSERYAALATGVIGTDAITTALIFQPAAVTPVGAHALLDSTVDPRFDTAFNRPSLAQTFQQRDTGGLVTVSVNHLKSKGSACDTVGDPLDPNGQGNCNGVRTQAATALSEWLASDPTGQGTDNTLIIGDLNSYDHEDPIVALEAAGYTDLLGEFGGEEAYSYVFDGQLGYLDYALASPALRAQVTGAAAWHANSDEVPILDYSMEFKQPAQDALYAPDPYRASDHDAVLVGLELAAPATSVTVFDERRPADAAAAISASWAVPGTPVYLVDDRDPVARAVATAAAAHDGATLLLAGARVPAATLDEIARVQPAQITVVGDLHRRAGLELQQLGLPIRQLTGESDAALAATVATEVFGTAQSAVIVPERVTAEVAVAAATAAAIDRPLLITAARSVSEPTAAALESLGTLSAIVVGDRRDVRDSVIVALRDGGVDADRVAGEDASATAALLALDVDQANDAGVLVLAEERGIADALAAAQLAGVHAAPMLLTDRNCVSLDAADAAASIDPRSVLFVGETPADAESLWSTVC